MERWYVLDESVSPPTPMGPLTHAELELMVQDGVVKPTTRVASVGSGQWICAFEDPRLAGLFQGTPPVSPDGVPPVPGIGARSFGPYSFESAFRLGWKSLLANWGHWIALVLVWGVVVFVAALPQGILQIALTGAARRADHGPLLPLLLGAGCCAVLLQLFIAVPMFVGLMYAAAQIHEGEGRILDVFQGFRRYGRVLLASILLGAVKLACAVLALLPLLVLAAVNGVLTTRRPLGPGVALVGGAAAVAIVIVLAVLVLLRLFHAPVIAIDPKFGNPTVLEAFRISWRNTAGLGLSMLGLLVVTGVIAALSIVLLCVGYILIGLPLMASVLGAMYVLVQRSTLRQPPSAA